MKETKNLKLKKPDYTDVADIADINANMDIIDENLGRVTVPTYTDTKNNKYTDINGMHLRTDNAIYAKGGIKIVSVDPCTDGENLTEVDVSRETVNLYVLAKIDENGNAVFKELEASNLDVGDITADMVAVDGATLQELALHFKRAKGALYTDNSAKIASDGSRKFILGVYKDIPSVDKNLMPTTLPNAGVVTRVESDVNGNGTYVELYGLNIVCRTDNAVFKVATVKADTIRAGRELKIGDLSVAELIAAKADGTHSHTLTDSEIEGTLPISKGGTGATTAVAARTNLGLGTAATKGVIEEVRNNNASLVTSGAVYTAINEVKETITPISKGGTGATTAAAARTNLGLGTAATKGVATAVSNGNTNLVTSGAVYSAINNLNINNRTHIVVATYDTKNPLKANADYTCTSTNASSVLKSAINAVAQGGKIELLDGTYNLQYSEDEINLTKDITIEGCGYRTTIHQPVDEAAGEAKPVFVINGQNVKLKSMMLCDKNVSSPVPIIRQQTQGATYDDVFFIFNAGDTSGGGACISGSNDCNYTRIQNCRVYKGFNDSNRAMFDFGNCTKFGGVFGANISSGYNTISIKFANEGHKNNTAIYGHSNIDITVNA